MAPATDRDVVYFETTDPTQARTILLGLLVECPLGGNPEDCPFCAHRELPMADRKRWVDELDDAEVLAALARHRRCYATRSDHSGPGSEDGGRGG